MFIHKCMYNTDVSMHTHMHTHADGGTRYHAIPPNTLAKVVFASVLLIALSLLPACMQFAILGSPFRKKY